MKLFLQNMYDRLFFLQEFVEIIKGRNSVTKKQYINFGYRILQSHIKCSILVTDAALLLLALSEVLALGVVLVRLALSDVLALEAVLVRLTLSDVLAVETVLVR